MEEKYRFTGLQIFIRPGSIMDPISQPTQWVGSLHFNKSWFEEKKYLEIDLKLEIVNKDIIDLIEEAKNLITTKTFS